MANIKQVETWETRKGTKAKIVVRNERGQFHGATNFKQKSKVGQVAKSRR